MHDVRFLRVGAIVLFAAVTMYYQCIFSAAVGQEGSAAPGAKQDESPAATSAADAEERLHKKLHELCEEHHLPALWAGKFYADGRAIVASSGVRKWQNESPVRPQDCVHIGSCTKAMTAVMVAQLCSQGSLSLDSKLGEIFADEDDVVNSAWSAVTVADLLQHRSGAPANADWQKLHAGQPDDPVAARRAMLKWLSKQKRPDKPTFVYSNVGYALLGHIVESLEGQAWESLIATKVFEPLEMKSAGLGPLSKADENGKPIDAWGHAVRGGLTELLSGLFGSSKVPNHQPIQIDNPPPLGPAGRAHMNLADWSRFALLFASDQGYEKVGVKPEIWSKLVETNGMGNYAGGWVLIERDWAGGRVLFHNGSNTTWYCVAFVAPQKGYCLLAATNIYSAAAQKACDQAVKTADDLGF